MAVVSQGLDVYIQAGLEREGVGRVPVYAVDTKFEGGEISYHYNHTDPGKEDEGNSKGIVVQSFQKQGLDHWCLWQDGGEGDYNDMPLKLGEALRFVD